MRNIKQTKGYAAVKTALPVWGSARLKVTPSAWASFAV